MSALTIENISVIARRRLNTPASEAIQYQPLVGQALISLARKVARRDDFTEIRKEIAVTCTSGIITITDIQVLLETLDKTGTLILNGIEAKFVERFDDLRPKLPTDVYWAALRNRKIYVKDITMGTLGTVNQTGTLDANYTPALDQLPSAYDEELLDEVVMLAKGLTETLAARIDGSGEPSVVPWRVQQEWMRALRSK